MNLTGLSVTLTASPDPENGQVWYRYNVLLRGEKVGTAMARKYGGITWGAFIERDRVGVRFMNGVVVEVYSTRTAEKILATSERVAFARAVLALVTG